MSSARNSKVMSDVDTQKGQQVQGVEVPKPSRLLAYQGDRPSGGTQRCGNRSEVARCRESVLRFFYPDNTCKRATQRRDIFLLAFHAVQQLPPTDKWSYYQIAGIHGLPYKPYDGDAGPWDPKIQNKWWGGYCEHGSPLFPTWHRSYVMLLEQSIILQARELAETLFQNQPTVDDSQKLSNVYTSEIKNEQDEVRDIINKELCFPYWDWVDHSTRVLGVPDVFTSTEISLSYNWKCFTTRTIPNPLKSFVLPKDVGMPYASSDVYNPAAKPHYVVPAEGVPFTPAGYPTVRHVNSSYESQIDKLNLAVVRKAGSTLVEGVYSMFKLKEWLPFSNHYWNGETHVDGERYEYGHYPSLELVHDELHLIVGGAGGQMRYPECAAFDPIFFFHHCNVDRLTALWQYCYPDKWIDDQLQTICDGTYTIPPDTPAHGNTDLTPFRFPGRRDKFVSSNDVRTVDKDCGYTYPELQTAQENDWSPRTMFLYLEDLYQPPERFVQNWYLVSKGIIKRIFNGVYSIRVFINKPDATGHTPVSDPHFAGEIYIFARSNIAWCANCEWHQSMRASLNLTKTMVRLGITIAPETPDDAGSTLKDKITFVYLNGKGQQVNPHDVGWEGPNYFIYYQEGVDQEGVDQEGVDQIEDIENFRQDSLDKTPADLVTGELHIFKL